MTDKEKRDLARYLATFVRSDKLTQIQIIKIFRMANGGSGLREAAHYCQSALGKVMISKEDGGATWIALEEDDVIHVTHDSEYHSCNGYVDLMVNSDHLTGRIFNSKECSDKTCFWFWEYNGHIGRFDIDETAIDFFELTYVSPHYFEWKAG